MVFRERMLAELVSLWNCATLPTFPAYGLVDPEETMLMEAALLGVPLPPLVAGLAVPPRGTDACYCAMKGQIVCIASFVAVIANEAPCSNFLIENLWNDEVQPTRMTSSTTSSAVDSAWHGESKDLDQKRAYKEFTVAHVTDRRITVRYPCGGPRLVGNTKLSGQIFAGQSTGRTFFAKKGSTQSWITGAPQLAPLTASKNREDGLRALCRQH